MGEFRIFVKKKKREKLQAECLGRSKQDRRAFPSSEKGLPLGGRVWEGQEKMWVPEAWEPEEHQDTRSTKTPF